MMSRKGEEAIGLAAGEVWRYLHRKGEATPSKIAKETGLSEKEVQRAIGWLAREGKLEFHLEGRREILRLREG